MKVPRGEIKKDQEGRSQGNANSTQYQTEDKKTARVQHGH